MRNTRPLFAGLTNEEVERLLAFWRDYVESAEEELERRKAHPVPAPSEEVVA